jgi:hypothetical protein
LPCRGVLIVPVEDVLHSCLEANVVNVRTLGSELVLEFASFFPDGERQFPPKDFPPEVRVVVPKDLVGPLVDILHQRLAPTESCGDGTRAN